MSTIKPPTILDATNPTRPASIIFLHGYDDEADGLPLGLAQQFQFASKLPHIRWVLPNAPFLRQVHGRGWYIPRSLVDPDILAELDAEGQSETEEEGILRSVDYVDTLVQQELNNGVDGGRIMVGGFSQGCAVSVAYSILGRTASKIRGIIGLSGYFPLPIPLSSTLGTLRSERNGGMEGVEYFLAHGTKDMLISRQLFGEMVEKVGDFIDDKEREKRIEIHVYEGMGHSTCSAELRDILGWVERVVPG